MRYTNLTSLSALQSTIIHGVLLPPQHQPIQKQSRRRVWVPEYDAVQNLTSNPAQLAYLLTSSLD
ncbi:hypothetical protein M441DRAFT_53117 [Trichoderma asperellum CBS 433.97]|uniref:Uncharacterized protein n=1 Tax=Trichoderma asperellum (strain ATCC 204424 / CBS 433.97 / NBRC 101777) TaxID=1042311 RepID=A0A2T3ZNK4_TRIA4|nr:hypothetical protein M441DRAFT_53117 [Trichoderma asperellum CBS 433.97]PTB46379.1 hypothetical protein M441DRAFT_53117 [Trichoderma asperellum CBS 433.97]